LFASAAAAAASSTATFAKTENYLEVASSEIASSEVAPEKHVSRIFLLNLTKNHPILILYTFPDLFLSV
jgi:hypothetical protein